jgi:Cu2+-exporting ATPase
MQELSPKEKSLLLSLVHSSLHPVAACLREFLLPSGIEPDMGGAIEVTGLGLERTTDHGVWRLGRPSWAGGKSEGTTSFTLNGRELASFSFREELRPGALEEVASLREGGREVYLLSGDDSGRVSRLASDLGLAGDQAFGNLSPEGKSNLIQSRWAENSLMIGDGANDSLAFDAALCRGTPSVDTGLLEHKADFYMPGTGLGGLTSLFQASRKHAATTRAVFAFAILYNATAVTASLAGLMNPLIAAVIMPLSSLASIGIVLLGFHATKKNLWKTQT